MKKKYSSLFPAVFVAVLAGSVYAEQKPVKVESSLEFPHHFPPAGWIVERQVEDDLNGDGIADLAAVLIQDLQSTDKNGMVNERERRLAVLLSSSNKTFVLIAGNDKILQCAGCGGAKEGVTLSIKKGVLLVNQMSGSREFTDQTWRFRFDLKSRRFVLIGMDVDNGDSGRGTGRVDSYNYLVGSKTIEQYRYDKSGSHRIRDPLKKESVPVITPFMEDTDGE